MSAMLCTIFSELCLEERPCDVVISVDGYEFNAHKNILCGCSQYFRALFSTSWSNAGKVFCKIPGTSPEMMRLIIGYAYTGTVLVMADNVECLLIAADQFNVMGVVRLCCEFLKSQLCLENCVGIWKFTDYYYCPDLREAVHVFILHHLQEMTQVSTEFLELSVNELQRVLEKEGLREKEEAVFEAILKWIAHDPQNRRQHVAVFLGKAEWKG